MNHAYSCSQWASFIMDHAYISCIFAPQQSLKLWPILRMCRPCCRSARATRPTVQQQAIHGASHGSAAAPLRHSSVGVPVPHLGSLHSGQEPVGLVGDCCRLYRFTAARGEGTPSATQQWIWESRASELSLLFACSLWGTASSFSPARAAIILNANPRVVALSISSFTPPQK